MIKNNIFTIRKLLPSPVTIVAVSKGRTVDEIKEAIEAGITDIGENRVQEAVTKYRELLAPDSQLPAIKWHLVGHLQTNKVKEAIKIFDLIHSLDSIKLAVEIDKAAAAINKVQDVLIEVNISGEQSKFGINPSEAIGFIKRLTEYKNINIKGLMTIAPIVNDSEQARPYFRKLRELKDKINELQAPNFKLLTLSIGMSDDYKVAVEEGSNMVRLGRVIFSRQ